MSMKPGWERFEPRRITVPLGRPSAETVPRGLPWSSAVVEAPCAENMLLPQALNLVHLHFRISLN